MRRSLRYFESEMGYLQKGSWKNYTVHVVRFCDYIILTRDIGVVESDFSNFGPRYLQRVDNARVSSAIYQSVYMLWRGHILVSRVVRRVDCEWAPIARERLGAVPPLPHLFRTLR